MQTASNWSSSSRPNNSNDIGLTSSSTILTNTAGTITGRSINVTNSNSYTIVNSTTAATNSTINLGVSGVFTNGISGSSNDLIYLFNTTTAPNLTIQGPNSSTGTGVLNLVLNGSGNFNIGTGSTLAISSAINGAYSITKTGAGNLFFSGANTYSGKTTITSGILQLGAANAIPVSAMGGGVILNGGTLSTGASTGFSEGVAGATNMGTLTLSDNSTIALGTGSHSLYFSASNGTLWTSSKVITISGWKGTAGASGTEGKIFLGSSSNGLTSSQLVQIYFAGYANGTTILSTGEVVPAASIATPPTISAIANQTADNDFKITFADNATWRSLITGITVDGTSYLAASNAYTLSSGSLVLKRASISELNNATSHTIVVSATGYLTTSVTQTNIAGSFTKLQILMPGETAAAGTISGKIGNPTIQTRGIPFNVVVNGVDAYWNTVSNVSDNIAITSTDGSAFLPPNSGLVNGTNMFSVALNMVGAVTVTATDMSDGSKTANTSASITVNQITTATDYFRTKQSGNWANANTWESSFDGINWIASSFSPDSNANIITILNTHVITVAASVTVDQLVVNIGGQIMIGALQTLTINDGSGIDLVVSGTILNAGTITNNGQINFAAASTYTHSQNGGIIPFATWATTSNCNITGVSTTMVMGLGQSFGNFLWDCASQNAILYLGTAFTTVNGNLKIRNTGSANNNTSYLNLATSTDAINYVLNIGGNLIDSTATTNNGNDNTSTFVLSNGSNTIINVAGNVYQYSNTNVNFSQTSGYAATLNVAGNYIIQNNTGSAATFARTYSNFSISKGRINFIGKSQTFTQNYGTTTFFQYIDIYIGNGIANTTVTMNSGVNLTAFSTLSVANNATLILGTNIIADGDASCTFTLNGGGTLSVGSSAGISSSGKTGNINTKMRNYASSANYIFTGEATGLFTTTPNVNTVNNLTINTSSNVALSQSLTVSNAISLINGTLTIGANTLTMAGGTIYKDGITYSGVIDASNGTFACSGTLGLTIPANTFLRNTVNNLIINNIAGVTLGGTLNITGVLSPKAGSLITNGNLTLLSTDVNGGGIIAAGSNSGGYINGNVTIQRFTQAQRGYRTFAHPYNTSQTIAQLTDNFQITGLTSGSLGAFGLSTGNPSAFAYNPTASSSPYVNPLTRITNSDYSWGVGQGLYVFVRGNGHEGTGGSYASSGGVPSAVIVDVSGGIVNQGPVAVGIGYADNADNYNLIGNPYPSPINLKNVLVKKDSDGSTQTLKSFLIANSTIYTYTPVLAMGSGSQTTLRGGFKTITHDGNTDIIIPTMGAFYIKAPQSGFSIYFQESDKVNITPTLGLFGTNSVIPKLRLAISTNVGFMDDIQLAFDKNSSAYSGDKYDAMKLSNSLLDFYTLSSDKKTLAIDYRSTNVLDSIIPLGIQTAMPDNYNISLSELTNLPNIQLVLRDKLLKTETVLSQLGDSYSFTITADTATKGDNRFEIGLLSTTVLPVTITDITAQLQTNKTVAVNWTSATEVNLASYHVQRSLDGTNFSTIGKVAAKGADTYNYIDDLSSIYSQAATLYYRLEAVDNNGSKSYSKVVNCQLAATSTSINIYPNPVQSTLHAQITATNAGTLQISVIDAQGKVVVTQKTAVAIGTNSIAVPVAPLTVGNYMLEIESTNGKQIRRFVKE
ncbi:beta strand repeat-containing protein [Parasediminibacterium paludis]|uniref:Beta strand repeat-containing protein n=1 Tax=Parasediminibacterium paludis TaxID=908966 RepID=A0ABV8PTE5_9BACT